MNLLDRAVELEWRFIVIIERHWRPKRDTDVKTVIGGEEQRRADRHGAFGNNLTGSLHRDLERAAGPRHDIARLDFDLHLAGRQLFRGADLRTLNDEKVVFIAQDAVFNEAGQAA